MKVAFLKGNGICDRVIQAGTWGPYSHCEFIFSDGIWFGNKPYSDFSVFFHDPYKDQTNWDLVEIPAFYNESESIAFKLAQKMNGKCYDWKGIFLSQVLPLSMQDDDKYFCSEAVMHLLKALGMYPTTHPLQSPNAVRRLLRKAGV